MGYTTNFRGLIQITPALRWAQIKGSPFMPENAKSGERRDCMFAIEKFSRDTNEGRLEVVQATGLISTWDSEATGYNMVEHVQQVVDAFPDHQFSGSFDCEGEESGDIWRLEITHDRQAVEVRPLVVWPDSSAKASKDLGDAIEESVREYFDMKSTTEAATAFRLIGVLKKKIQVYLLTIGEEAGR